MPAPSAPSRILMTADTVGGVWTYALELAEAISQHGVEVALATLGAPLTDEQQAAARCLENVEIFESDFKLEWMEDPWEEVQAAGDWLLGLEARLRPDLVHLNGYTHGARPWQAPALVVGHSCVFSWFAAVEHRKPPARWQRYRRKVARGLRQAGAVAAPTKAMLEALHQHYGPFTDGPHASGQVIYNGRAAAHFQPKAKEPFVLAAGRLWDEAKNVGTLAQVAPRLDWPVRLAGAGRSPEGGGPAQFEDVQLLGRLSAKDLASQMGRASIFALPARYEPFGLSALEAGLAGCALVLGDIPSLREVWGEAALFVPPDDPGALEDALRRLIGDAALREQMARRARCRARTYTPRRMAEGYIALYDTLLHDRQAASASTEPA